MAGESVRVDDPDDSRIAAYRDVGDADALRRRGVFVAEGRLVVERLIRDGRFSIESLLVTPAAHAAMGEALGSIGAPVLVCDPHAMRAVTGFNFHRGCLGLVRRPEATGSLEQLVRARRLFVLEGIGNPDNIGAIFRVALALGADGIVLDERCGDPFYRKAIRTSMAATLRVPFARMRLTEALPVLRADGWQIVALTPSADAIDIACVPRGSKIALALGSEGAGLSEDAFALADVRARIAIQAAADSLNVAVAAAVALYALR